MLTKAEILTALFSITELVAARSGGPVEEKEA
jgi:hypothetical protein